MLQGHQEATRMHLWRRESDLMLTKGVCFQQRKVNGIKRPQECDELRGGRCRAGVEEEALLREGLPAERVLIC